MTSESELTVTGLTIMCGIFSVSGILFLSAILMKKSKLRKNAPADMIQFIIFYFISNVPLKIFCSTMKII